MLEESVDKVKLYEFETDDHDLVKLTGIVSQIHNRIKDTGYDKKFSLEALLNILRDRELDITPEQFIEMSQNSPLKNIIANVSGNSIVFKGESDVSTDVEKPDETTSTLEKMAKRAAKK